MNKPQNVRNTDRIGYVAGASKDCRLHIGRKSEKDDEIYVRHDDEEVDACLHCTVKGSLCNGNCSKIRKIRKLKKEGGCANF